MVSLARPDLMEKLPGWGAALGAAAVGTVFVALPDAWLEAAVEGTGVAALLPVAAPPLGATARAVLALGGGVLTAAIAWAALYILFGDGGFVSARLAGKDGVPALRRADAHPDAPWRQPLSVATLEAVPMGARPMQPSDPVPMTAPLERTVPANLDTPLAALDPAAIPAVPREPVRAVPALAPGERLQTFALTPPAPPKPQPVSEPASIEALLRRLEQGAGKRVAVR